MKCPNCGELLSNHIFKGVRIDECGSCHGKWFGRDELRQAKDNTDDDLRWLDFDLFADENEKFEKKESKLLCPKDNTKLTSSTYLDSKVIIEKCESCQGVWLEKSEFEKIIKYLENKIIKTTADEYAKETIAELKEIFAGPENKISEIKDFFAVTNLFSMRIQAEHRNIASISEDFVKFWPIR